MLISDSGSPLLADFGISRVLSETATIFQGTTSGSTRGTARYIAREILSPSDPRSPIYTKEADVWAFGMTIYVRLHFVSFLFISHESSLRSLLLVGSHSTG